MYSFVRTQIHIQKPAENFFPSILNMYINELNNVFVHLPTSKIKNTVLEKGRLWDSIG